MRFIKNIGKKMKLRYPTAYAPNMNTFETKIEFKDSNGTFKEQELSPKKSNGTVDSDLYTKETFVKRRH